MSLTPCVSVLTGDGAGPYCESLLHHPRDHGHLQPAAEADPQRDRALPRLLSVVRVQAHQCPRGEYDRRGSGSEPVTLWQHSTLCEATLVSL